jgi:hypothetical protein
MTAVVVAIGICAALAAAQTGRGEIVGTATDHTGAVLPGVTVSASGPDRRTTVTDERGQFALGGLLPGAYEIRAELPGFVTTVNHALVTTGITMRVDVQLAPATVAEAVTVTSEAPPAQPESGVGGGLVGGFPGGVVGGVVRSLPAPPLGTGQYSAAAPFRRAVEPPNTESYDHIDEPGLRRVTTDPLMLLRASEHRGDASYHAVVSRARACRGTDREGYRAEFVRMVELATLRETSR